MLWHVSTLRPGLAASSNTGLSRGKINPSPRDEHVRLERHPVAGSVTDLLHKSLFSVLKAESRWVGTPHCESLSPLLQLIDVRQDATTPLCKTVVLF